MVSIIVLNIVCFLSYLKLFLQSKVHYAASAASPSAMLPGMTMVVAEIVYHSTCFRLCCKDTH